MRILRFAQNDKEGTLGMTEKKGGASLRSPPPSGCAGQLPRPAPHGMADKRPGRTEAIICPGPGRRGIGKVAAGGGVPWTA